VPFNSAGTTGGVALAPSALRRAGVIDALRSAGVAVDDGGDISLGPTLPARDPESGIIWPAALIAMIGAVRDAVATCRREDSFPIVLGGDCAVLIGCLADAYTDVGLLFVDGHEDAWPPTASPTGEAADMELRILLGRAAEIPPALMFMLGIPRLDPERVMVVGARDQAELREAGVASIDTLVDTFRTEGVGPAKIMSAIEDRVRRLDGLGPWWLHVDLDVLSTTALAAVDYQQPGGLDWPVLTALTRRALASEQVIGWTVTIYNPERDPVGAGAAAIVRYLADAAPAIRAWNAQRS